MQLYKTNGLRAPPGGITFLFYERNGILLNRWDDLWSMETRALHSLPCKKWPEFNKRQGFLQ